MEFKFEGITISNEEDLCKLAQRINSDDEFARKLKEYGIQENLIDEKSLVKRYQDKKAEIRDFRIKHECKLCEEYNMDLCKGTPPCKYENYFQKEKRDNEKSICPMDKTGDCPYGRAEGICIGPCYREIIKKYRRGDG